MKTKSAKAAVFQPRYRMRKEPAKKGKGAYRRRDKHVLRNWRGRDAHGDQRCGNQRAGSSEAEHRPHKARCGISKLPRPTMPT